MSVVIETESVEAEDMSDYSALWHICRTHPREEDGACEQGCVMYCGLVAPCEEILAQPMKEAQPDDCIVCVSLAWDR